MFHRWELYWAACPHTRAAVAEILRDGDAPLLARPLLLTALEFSLDANTFELTHRKVALQSQHAAAFFARKTSS